MFNLTGKTYSKYLLLSVLSVWVVLGALTYSVIISYESNRIYNPRKVPKEYRVELIKDYIDRVYKKSSILFIGDSQPNGHLFPTNKIFTTLLENKINKNVLNLSFQDARILDNIYILTYLKDNNMTFNKIIFNVNQSHIKVNNFTRLEVEKKKDYKLAIWKNLKSFTKLSLQPNPTSTPKEAITLKKYDNYFDMNHTSIKNYSNKLLKLIKLSKSIADDTIIYITPHSHNAILYNNKDDIIPLENFSKVICTVCKNENVKCLEPNIVDDKYYIDIVHFNSLGHEKMSNILNTYLK